MIIKKEPLTSVPHENPLINAMTYITNSLTFQQVIEENGRIKKMCQKSFPNVTDEIYEEALDVLHRGSVITHREKGVAYQTNTILINRHRKPLNNQEILKKFKTLSQQ
jgi:hypothetical protein